MKKICKITGLNEKDFFAFFINTLKTKITKWDYFVNWDKVFKNIKPIEKELNLLNFLIGKENFIEEATSLILEYPQVVKAIPKLLAIRENSLEVLVDVNNFIYEIFDFTNDKPSKEDAVKFAYFLLNSGIGNFLIKKKIRNLVDYTIGVEVGLDSNARKNRTGTLMESIVEIFVANACIQNKASYISQATKSKIQKNGELQLK